MTNNFKLFGFVLIASAAVCFSSCTKEKVAGMGAVPVVDFAAVPGTNPNDITLVNKSATPTIPYWTIGTQKLTGDSAFINFSFPGTYKVTMFGIGRGGLDSITKDVVIAQKDPNACINSQLGFLASCSTKVWKLNPDAGAYKVGDQGVGAGNWWTSPASEPAARPCEFNDEYSFSFDTYPGTFKYDNKGDFYGDGYLGNNSGACQPSSNYTTEQAPWGSGTFQYIFAANAGVNKLGQITLIGLGAHIGVQKARNGAEITTPASSITYDILSATHNAAGYDLMTVGVQIAGNGWWSFTLRSY